MSTIDENLFSIKTLQFSDTQNEELLQNWVNQYQWNEIKSELLNLSSRKLSKDEVLKFLPNPIRLEFLTALAIKSKFPKVRVIPNYRCDDTGLPTSTAGGNMGDIECFENQRGVLIEVTMAEGRTQTMMEIWPIERHLRDFKEKYTNNSQCVFVAPSIYSDSERQIKFVEADKGYIIRPYKIIDFITFLETNKILYCE